MGFVTYSLFIRLLHTNIKLIKYRGVLDVFTDAQCIQLMVGLKFGGSVVDVIKVIYVRKLPLTPPAAA